MIMNKKFLKFCVVLCFQTSLYATTLSFEEQQQADAALAAAITLQKFQSTDTDSPTNSQSNNNTNVTGLTPNNGSVAAGAKNSEIQKNPVVVTPTALPSTSTGTPAKAVTNITTATATATSASIIPLTATPAPVIAQTTPATVTTPTTAPVSIVPLTPTPTPTPPVTQINTAVPSPTVTTIPSASIVPLNPQTPSPTIPVVTVGPTAPKPANSIQPSMQASIQSTTQQSVQPSTGAVAGPVIASAPTTVPTETLSAAAPAYSQNQTGLSSFVNRTQDFATQKAVQEFLVLYQDVLKTESLRYNTISLWKTLNNPHRARQILLSSLFRYNNEQVIYQAASKLLSDIAPGIPNDTQVRAVISASFAAFKDRGVDQNPIEDLLPEDIVQNRNNPNADLTETVITPESCPINPQLPTLLPNTCSLFSVNYYGSNGVNNFFALNVNGQLQTLWNFPVRIKGPVKWSITYTCQTTAGVSSPDPSTVSSPLSTTQKPQPINALPNRRAYTTINLSCDKGGLKIIGGSYITGFVKKDDRLDFLSVPLNKPLTSTPNIG